jgi:hypothetical protein
VNILSIENETAGLRVDDLILLFFSFFLSCAFLWNNKKFISIELLLFFIVATSLISFIINHLLVASDILQVKAKIFYVVRIAEYFLFFYAGRMLFEILTIEKIVNTFLLINILFMILQKFGLAGTITGLNTQTIDMARVSGIASFPAEMGGVLNIIFCFLLFNKPQHIRLFNIQLSPHLEKIWKDTRPYRLFLLFIGLTAPTGARIALASTFIIFILYLIHVNKKSWLRFVPAFTLLLVLAIPVAYIVIINTDSIFGRSSRLLSTNNFSIISDVWNAVDTNIDIYDNINSDSGEYDMSWWMRLNKWCYALKIYVTRPECYLQGVGPGAFSSAVDGSYVRILTENGVIGGILYFLFFRYIYKQSETLKWIVFSFLLNMIFFDVYLAYKTMTFLFLISGYYYALNQVPTSNTKFKQKSKFQWAS